MLEGQKSRLEWADKFVIGYGTPRSDNAVACPIIPFRKILHPD
jgi:hypothetical protein